MAIDYEQVRAWVDSYGPAAVGVGSTLDNTGVPIFFVAGLAAAVSLKSSLAPMWVAAFVGSVVGDLAVYAIGRYGLTREKLQAGFLGRSMGPTLAAGERMMARWGWPALAFGRFVPYVGKVLPLLAGSYRKSWASAISAVAVGSFLLTGLYFLLGEIAVDLVRSRGDLVRYASLAALGVVVVGLYYANIVLKRKNSVADAPAPDPDAPVEL